MDEKMKEAVVTAARDTLKDERHWSVVGSEDRAENGKCLAEMILQLLGFEEDECPAGCQECKAHEENTQ